MDHNQLAERLGVVVKFLDGKMAGKPLPPDAKPELMAEAAENRELAALVLAGVELAGELLLDVKRIADAAGPPSHLHLHCPDGSVLSAAGDAVRIEPWLPPEHDVASAVERVARLLASKEAFRKIMDEVPLPELTARREAWVDGNWRAFQDEAAEILAAAIPGARTS